MKRRSLKFIACAAIMAMTLSVTACGGSDDAAPATETEAPAEDAAEETPAEDTAEAEPETEAEPEAEAEAEPEADAAEAEPEADAEASSAEADSLEALYSDPTVKSAFDSVFSALAEEGMEVNIEVTGNEMAVIIKITDSSMVADGMGEALEAALDQQASNFETQVKQFDEAVGTPGACTVTMRYLDPDDNVLAEKSFSAK